MNTAIRIGTGLSAHDERAISAVLISYATGIDQRDWPLFHSLFTPDCDADYGSFGKWHGANAITEYMKQAHADLGATLHRISNIEIRSVDGGVQSRCYVDALLCPIHEGGPLHRGIGYYDDHLTRTANGWQIARRQFHAVLLE
ncbi:nuclear transport factor 2 family protein [Novosphingobium sp. AAP93]|uniref:nuclear transport factor 2 family protein n=1 Tax=Novosphingobium sp. AAP93 TaxID=1523427 RepID=UPI0006B96B1E|nr:nuclear transport factor 2 family protein [Novosphingobium sp. AAP93]KPF84147.1 polyketide cyclase [Novosphingobium sp. AAP93]